VGAGSTAAQKRMPAMCINTIKGPSRNEAIVLIEGMNYTFNIARNGNVGISVVPDSYSTNHAIGRWGVEHAFKVLEEAAALVFKNYGPNYRP